tara:strand:+ start:502 stop:654 length:153 start_codon:yes stop_codon:yes gene_type:complete
MQVSMMNSVLTQKKELQNMKKFEEYMKNKFISLYNLTDIVEKLNSQASNL